MLNQVVIMGRLVRDPEARTTAAGITYTNFTVAVDRDLAPKDGGEKGVDFIDCVAWRKTAEFIISYFQKGRMIALAGRLQVDSWTDKDGNKRKSAKVAVNNAYFAGDKKDSSGNQQGTGNSYGGYPETQDAINRYMGGYQNHAPVYPSEGEAFAQITDDDAQLPF